MCADAIVTTHTRLAFWLQPSVAVREGVEKVLRSLHVRLPSPCVSPLSQYRPCSPFLGFRPARWPAIKTAHVQFARSPSAALGRWASIVALGRRIQVARNFDFLCYLARILVPTDFWRAATARTVAAFEESTRDYAPDNGRFLRR